MLQTTNGNAAMPAREDLAAENARLRDALAPFSLAYRPDAHRDADPRMQAFLDANQITPNMTMGDFRRAYEALTPSAEQTARD